jgi:EAL domain-containing protein (putative c-di-GMP-specific phosphodiesterase class I)
VNRRSQPGITQDVREAIAKGEIELQFQPIASLSTGRVEAVEAIPRWRHPELGLLSPALFRPVVEASESSRLFTLHELELAAGHARDWFAAGRQYQVAFNISADLVKNRFAGTLPAILSDLGVPPHMFTFEISETALVQDQAGVTAAVAELAELGLGGITLENFGTDDWSLRRLRNLRIDSLKLDRAFVPQFNHGSGSVFVRAAIELGHRLGLRVLADGVDREETWHALSRLDCDAAQGDWLSPPLSADQLTADGLGVDR